MAILRLIRLPNLLMLALMQLVFKYGFLSPNHVPQALAGWQYLLLVLSTVCIAAGGYVINDIFDQETDAINRPEKRVVGVHIPEARAYNWYIGLNITGVAAGFVIANLLGHPMLAAVFIIVASALYFYATSFRQQMLTGNVLVAALLAFSVLVVGIFDLYPIIDNENRAELGLMFKIMLDYAAFAFLINLMREIVKDLEDVEGDDMTGMRTLAITLGRERTTTLLFWFSLVPILILGWYVNHYFIANNLFLVTGYAIFLVVAPLVYVTVRLWSAATKKDFAHLSSVLKAVIFFGIMSVAVLTYDIGHHG